MGTPLITTLVLKPALTAATQLDYNKFIADEAHREVWGWHSRMTSIRSPLWNRSLTLRLMKNVFNTVNVITKRRSLKRSVTDTHHTITAVVGLVVTLVSCVVVLCGCAVTE